MTKINLNSKKTECTLIYIFLKLLHKIIRELRNDNNEAAIELQKNNNSTHLSCFCLHALPLLENNEDKLEFHIYLGQTQTKMMTFLFKPITQSIGVAHPLSGRIGTRERTNKNQPIYSVEAGI